MIKLFPNHCVLHTCNMLTMVISNKIINFNIGWSHVLCGQSVCDYFIFYFLFCKFYHRMPITFWLMQNDCHPPTWVLWTNHHTCLISTSSHFLNPNYFLALTCFANLCSWEPVWKSEIRRENNKSLLKLKLNTSKSFLFALVKKPSRLQSWSLFYILLWSIPHPHTQKPRRYMIRYNIKYPCLVPLVLNAHQVLCISIVFSWLSSLA